jgi:hypothetical protein
VRRIDARVAGAGAPHTGCGLSGRAAAGRLRLGGAVGTRRRSGRNLRHGAKFITGPGRSSYARPFGFPQGKPGSAVPTEALLGEQLRPPSLLRPSLSLREWGRMSSSGHSGLAWTWSNHKIARL